MMSVGPLLNSSCLIQQPTTTYDGSHSPIDTFATFIASTPCRFQPRNGNESPRYGRESTRNNDVFYVQSGLGITTKMRVIFGGLTFDIQAVKTWLDQGLDLVRLDVEETK